MNLRCSIVLLHQAAFVENISVLLSLFVSQSNLMLTRRGTLKPRMLERTSQNCSPAAISDFIKMRQNLTTHNTRLTQFCTTILFFTTILLFITILFTTILFLPQSFFYHNSFLPKFFFTTILHDMIN